MSLELEIDRSPENNYENFMDEPSWLGDSTIPVETVNDISEEAYEAALRNEITKGQHPNPHVWTEEEIMKMSGEVRAKWWAAVKKYFVQKGDITERQKQIFVIVTGGF
jgi:sirohydrochlorin ferrochelatase